MSTQNDPRRTQTADTAMMDNEEQNRRDEQSRRQYEQERTIAQQNERNTHKGGEQQAQHQKEKSGDESYAPTDTNPNARNDNRNQQDWNSTKPDAADKKDHSAGENEEERQETYRNTTDPQEHMEGPVSSLAHGVGDELTTNETKQEADNRKEENL